MIHCTFIKTFTCRDTADNLINAIRLDDGEIYGFNEWDEVELVDAELTIKA